MYKIEVKNGETFEFEDETEALANYATCAFYDIPGTLYKDGKRVADHEIVDKMAYWLGFHHKRFLNFNAWAEKYEAKLKPKKLKPRKFDA